MNFPKENWKTNFWIAPPTDWLRRGRQRKFRQIGVPWKWKRRRANVCKTPKAATAAKASTTATGLVYSSLGVDLLSAVVEGSAAAATVPYRYSRGRKKEQRAVHFPRECLGNLSLSVSHSRHTCSNCVCCCLSLKLRDSLRYSLTKGKDRQKTLTRERGRESEGPTTTWTTYFYYVQCFPKSNWSAVAVVFFLSTAWQHQRTMQEHKRERQFYLLNSACLLGWVERVCVCVWCMILQQCLVFPVRKNGSLDVGSKQCDQ